MSFIFRDNNSPVIINMNQTLKNNLGRIGSTKEKLKVCGDINKY